MEFDFKEPPKFNRDKILDEILLIANTWWKKRNDPVLLEQFTECCRKLSSQSIKNAEFSLMLLRNWAVKKGVGFERVHRFHIRIQIDDNNVIDLKINYHDYEYFVLVNDNVEKMFLQVNEIKLWLEGRFNLST